MKIRTSKTETTQTFYSAAKVFAATILIGFATTASAQTHTAPAKQRVSAIDMVTGQNNQYKSTGNETTGSTKTTTTASGTTVIKASKSAKVNTPTAYISGEDKYLKTKEEGKRYGEFEVYDINGKDKDAVMLGLLTNTLDRAKRYDDKGELDQKVTVATTTTDKIDEKGKVVKGEKVTVAAIRFNDKVFVIIGENDYRYLDGKKIVGDTKLSDALAKGKPITELTFFYELQHAGYVKDMTAKQFSSLTIAQKEKILNNSTVAGL